MAHLSTGAGDTFAVKVEVGGGIAQDRGPVNGLLADQVAHLDARSDKRGAAQRQAADCADVVLEL